MQEWLLELPLELRDRVVRSRRGQRLVYELRNRRTFADMFQHDRMLADRVRNEAYWAAIERYVTDSDVVIDVGAGTGVLSMLAAKRGARVHAVEHGPIVQAARAVAAANGFERIEFHHMHSSRLRLDERVDAIVHEQIGDALFDERVIDTISDLRERLLKPGGRIYPSRLSLYVEPVEVRADMRTPFAFRQRIQGIDFGPIEDVAALTHAYTFRRYRPFPFGKWLVAPEPVVSVDLHTASPGDLPRRIEYARPAIADGTLDGFCVYLMAHFDDEIWFTTAPDEPVTNWATPLLRVDPRPVRRGETIELSLSAEDLAQPATWRWPLGLE